MLTPLGRTVKATVYSKGGRMAFLSFDGRVFCGLVRAYPNNWWDLVFCQFLGLNPALVDFTGRRWKVLAVVSGT